MNQNIIGHQPWPPARPKNAWMVGEKCKLGLFNATHWEGASCMAYIYTQNWCFLSKNLLNNRKAYENHRSGKTRISYQPKTKLII